MLLLVTVDSEPTTGLLWLCARALGLGAGGSTGGGSEVIAYLRLGFGSEAIAYLRSSLGFVISRVAVLVGGGSCMYL